MIQLDTKNSLASIEGEASKIADFLTKIEARDQDFYKIVDDSDAANEILEYADEVKGEFDDFVLIGIW